jgi:hypothetical protein
MVPVDSALSVVYLVVGELSIWSISDKKDVAHLCVYKNM